MSLKSLTPNMIVKDVLATAMYYRDTLGFELVLGVPEGTEDVVFEIKGRPLAFAMLKSGGVELMIQSGESMAVGLPDYEPYGGGDGVTFYIDVHDVDGLYDRLKSQVTITKDMHTTFYGAREFHIRDCNGFLVSFAQRPGQH